VKSFTKLHGNVNLSFCLEIAMKLVLMSLNRCNCVKHFPNSQIIISVKNEESSRGFQKRKMTQQALQNAGTLHLAPGLLSNDQNMLTLTHFKSSFVRHAAKNRNSTA
jgi:hypothetical protein